MAPVGRARRTRRAFTLLELLAVITVISILMVILIPTVGSAITSTKKAKTRAQFAQWAMAIEGFRQEYGFYPDFGATGEGIFTDGMIDDAPKSKRFIETLSGRQLNGAALVATSPGSLAGNRKGVRFCEFAADEITSGDMLQDAFGNTEIVVLMDKNFDGIIAIATGTPPPQSDYLTAPVVKMADGTTTASPLTPASAVRAGVIFYSAGPGGGAADIVTSW